MSLQMFQLLCKIFCSLCVIGMFGYIAGWIVYQMWSMPGKWIHHLGITLHVVVVYMAIVLCTVMGIFV